jgi:phosphoribosylamine--glycine ligase
VDALDRVGIPAFGPTRAAARLESSKSFAKALMLRSGVPTGAAWTFVERAAAEQHVQSHAGPWVIKADGLAAGKGVLVTDDRTAALEWVARCFEGGFGAAGSTVLVEEHLSGPELSVFGVTDGHDVVLLEPARDYKRLLDRDDGPNTGGMGSYSPVDLPHGLLDRVRDEIMLPVIRTMAADGTPYVGFIYAGLILTTEGPKVIEFNARLGDPETQAVLPRLRTDLLDLILAALAGTVLELTLEWSSSTTVNVVLASAGYPDDPQKGHAIKGASDVGEGVLVFHAGTATDEAGRLVTAGGRVLSVVGMSDTLESAADLAHQAANRIRFSGRQFRSDIGR